MTADRATLKAAVLQAIPDGTAIACHGDAKRLADTIVDAVMAVVDEVRVTSDRSWPEYPFPCWDGKDDLYLVQAAGTWPLYASTNKRHAIDDYNRLMKDNQLGRVYIWRVTAIEVEEVAVQREIVREELVPKGIEVTS